MQFHTAPTATAEFLIAHPGTGVEASVGNPIPAPGGSDVTFEIRLRDADSADKAGWQADLLLDACKFETSASLVIVSFTGNIFPDGAIALPDKQVDLDGNVLHVMMGQLLFSAPYVVATEGLLATVTVRAKLMPDCPAGGSPANETTVAFRPNPGSFISAAGGTKYEMTLNTGYLDYIPESVPTETPTPTPTPTSTPVCPGDSHEPNDVFDAAAGLDVGISYYNCTCLASAEW